jgi:UDP-2,3-diacylglucosamine pyrophosphatase LpxH
MVGNHDWFYHLPGAKYHMLRQQVVRQMGLANAHDAPFPHDAAESEELLAVLRRHKVTARHGDLFDPLNFEGDRDAATLGDVMVIELLNRFVAEVETQLVAELPASTVFGLREIDNVRPLLLIPVWIDGLLERSCPFPSMRKRVKTVWDRLVDEFLAIDFVRQRDTWSPFDLVDGLQRALKFSKRLSVGWASSTLAWLHNLRGGPGKSYFTHALSEQDFRNRRSKHIVYGHTHAVESVPLDASYAEGYVLAQEYFNAGTWRRAHRQTILAPSECEFIAQDMMSYLVFFQGDERRGRPYETWSGALGFNPSEAAIHRIDPGKPARAEDQPASPPGIRHQSPHFSPQTSQFPTVPAPRVP